ncbi:nadph2 dehydrogenase [Fusarium albosuccineum]|uniref:Nadph2 dehydrogenase n=1 Tax=Fusarium albosuccineum TaxID=1237068 RepID=A0A8H4LQS9_9HYPO|nr:nadph2 dehydrogenase [Fusarium albosuccineum]
MTVSKPTKLFSPIKVGAVDLQHRVVLAPLTRRRADRATAVPADFAAEYYAQRASTGGLLISEGTFIAEEAGGMSHVPGIYSKEQIEAWKRITDAVHANGGFIFCQLWALGRVANPKLVNTVWSAGSKPFVPEGAASAHPPPELTVLTESDIDRFVGHYRQAALNAIEAGFDGVEIHGANGYLVDQFLQSNSNDRTDSYGGSVENRLRFPLRVLNAVSDAIGPERVGIRMSPFSPFQGMREADPLSVFVPWAKAIVKAQPSLAFVHAVEPRAAGSQDVPEHLRKAEDTLTPIREVLNEAGIKFIVAGGYLPEAALKHASETDDLVAFGRYFIRLFIDILGFVVAYG